MFPSPHSKSLVQVPSTSRHSQMRWVAACARRLDELRPGIDAANLAATLWSEVGHFDPELAAEMEHEAGLLDG